MTEEQVLLLGVVMLGMDPLKLEAALRYEQERNRMRREQENLHKCEQVQTPAHGLR